MESFIDTYSFEQRIGESTKMFQKKPNSICTIVEKSQNSNITRMDKKKFLIPKDLTIGQFIYIVRKRIQLQPEQAIFIFVNNILPASSCTISQIYDKYQNEDGFLYMKYSSENTFG
jgi:GABA(A) receptor-associated protein